MLRAMKWMVAAGVAALGLALGAHSVIVSGAVDQWIGTSPTNEVDQPTNHRGAPKPGPNAPAPTTKSSQSATPTSPPSAEKPKRRGPLWNGVTMTPSEARKALRALRVRPPHSMAEYSRDRFPHWNDATAWGWDGTNLPYEDCDVRAAALIRDGKNVTTNENCTVTGGTWRSAYDDSTLTDPGDVEGDHMVPLANAWRSGAHRWNTRKATQFANDPLVVLAAPASLNSSKGDRGPESWKPASASWCGYAVRWVEVKSKYRLAMTSKQERVALRTMLKTCRGGTQDG